MVRAKVAAIRSSQPNQTAQALQAERRDCLEHVSLAEQLTTSEAPRLWITHGVSGSGKTTGTEGLIQQHGALRLRSDVERKRLFGFRPSHRPKDEAQQQQLYSHSATQQTYERLADLASMLLRSGELVVVDATFLQRRFRDMFRAVAAQRNVPFRIVPLAPTSQNLSAYRRTGAATQRRFRCHAGSSSPTTPQPRTADAGRTATRGIPSGRIGGS